MAPFQGFLVFAGFVYHGRCPWLTYGALSERFGFYSFVRLGFEAFEWHGCCAWLGDLPRAVSMEGGLAMGGTHG